MSGLLSYGAYIPPTRLAFATISGRAPKPDETGPEKAVAWNDEDAVTMGVTAAVNCLRGFERDSVDAVYFASTSYAFGEKQASALIAKALDLRRDVRSADFSGSLRAGTQALRSAADAVAAGSARRVLVIVSDCRMAAPNSPLERNLGDAAVAFLVGDKDPVATLGASFAVADEIVDVWRSSDDRFVHSWEDRFIVKEGYRRNVLEAVQGFLQQSGCAAGDFARVALFAPDARSHSTVARELGIEREQLQDPLFGKLGNAGAAFSLLLLVAALEQARPGEKLLLVSYGDGAEVTAFEASEYLDKLDERRGVAWHLARRRGVRSYQHYLRARSLDPKEYQPGEDQGLSATIHFRERDEDISLRGQRCNQCSAVQFPNQRVCESCFAKDDFELVRLSDRTGNVVTYTLDFFFPTPEPPTIATVTEIDGARLHLQLVNTSPKEVRTGLPVEFEFRKIHEVGGRPNYYWKATPLPS